MWAVFLILFVTIGLFLRDRLPLELVAVMSMLALTFVGAISPQQAVSGFSNSVVVLTAALFVVGGALMATGVTQAVAEIMEQRSGGSSRRLCTMVVLSSTSLSTIMSSTGTTALLIPAVVRAAQRINISPSKFLIPLAYGSLMGGMLTLIGGTSNLIANDTLKAAGREGFSFFSFTPIGISILAVSMVYLLTVGDRLLPARLKPTPPHSVPSLDEILQDYEVLKDMVEIRLPGKGNWQAATLGELRLRSDHHIDVIALHEPATGNLEIPTVDSRLTAGMIVYARASPENASQYCASIGAIHQEHRPQSSQPPSIFDGRGIAEVLLTPRSKLAGRSLAQANFFHHYGVRVLKVRRSGQALPGEVANTELRFGDTLLVEGPWERLLRLKREPFDFVVVGLPRELNHPEGLSKRAWLSLAITAAMLVLMISDFVSPMMAALLAATLLILNKCITMEEAYSSINWGTIFLIAAMMPMGTALTQTGGIQQLTEALLNLTGHHGPWLTMAGVYFLSTMLGQVMSNTATAVLLAPLALGAANQLQVAPEAFLMAIAFGGSSAFLTPIASPGNTLVVDPGAYRFTDFLRVGLPLHAMSSAICLMGIPLLYPLDKV